MNTAARLVQLSIVRLDPRNLCERNEYHQQQKQRGPFTGARADVDAEKPKKILDVENQVIKGCQVVH